MRHGLNETILENLITVFAQFPKIQQVILYGSRAKGNYKNGSDIDLTIKGLGLTFQEMMIIETKIDELLLPYKIDLSQYNTLTNNDLIAHINRVGIVIFP